MVKLDETEFRQAMGVFATGVNIVTCRDAEQRPIGMTVNSFTSVSLDPPLVLWCVNRHILPFPAFSRTDHFAVHVLARDQEALSNHFAIDRADKFTGIDYGEGVAGLPIFPEFLGLYQCRVHDRIDAGDHIILVGQLVDYEIRDGEPLVFFGGDYHSLA